MTNFQENTDGNEMRRALGRKKAVSTRHTCHKVIMRMQTRRDLTSLKHNIKHKSPQTNKRAKRTGTLNKRWVSLATSSGRLKQLRANKLDYEKQQTSNINFRKPLINNIYSLLNINREATWEKQSCCWKTNRQSYRTNTRVYICEGIVLWSH